MSQPLWVCVPHVRRGPAPPNSLKVSHSAASLGGGAPPCLGPICSLLMESGVWEEKMLLQTHFQVGLLLNNVALYLGPSPAPRVTHT